MQAWQRSFSAQTNMHRVYIDANRLDRWRWSRPQGSTLYQLRRLGPAAGGSSERRKTLSMVAEPGGCHTDEDRVQLKPLQSA